MLFCSHRSSNMEEKKVDKFYYQYTIDSTRKGEDLDDLTFCISSFRGVDFVLNKANIY